MQKQINKNNVKLIQSLLESINAHYQAQNQAPRFKF